jgi:hypothetical protein
MYEQNVFQQQKLTIIAKATNDEAFREQLLDNPKEALERALGMTFPQGVTIQVHVMLPVNSQEGKPHDLSNAELEHVAGGWPDFLDNAVTVNREG